MQEPKERRRIRGPVAHIARVPLTDEEHAELVTIAELDGEEIAPTVRRAIKEYAERQRRR